MGWGIFLWGGGKIGEEGVCVGGGELELEGDFGFCGIENVGGI